MPEFSSDFLDNYLKKNRLKPRFWVHLIIAASLVLLFFNYRQAVTRDAMSSDEIKASLDFFSIDSSWVVKDEYAEEGYREVILVPEVSFRMKNTGKRDLRYVFLLGVFRFIDNGRNIGEGFQMTCRQPLSPGKATDSITLRSPFGYRAATVDDFSRQSKDFRPALVDVYARSKNSRLTQVKTFYIRHRIAGTELEVILTPDPEKKNNL